MAEPLLAPLTFRHCVYTRGRVRTGETRTNELPIKRVYSRIHPVEGEPGRKWAVGDQSALSLQYQMEQMSLLNQIGSHDGCPYRKWSKNIRRVNHGICYVPFFDALFLILAPAKLFSKTSKRMCVSLSPYQMPLVIKARSATIFY